MSVMLERRTFRQRSRSDREVERGERKPVRDREIARGREIERDRERWRQMEGDGEK